MRKTMIVVATAAPAVGSTSLSTGRKNASTTSALWQEIAQKYF